MRESATRAEGRVRVGTNFWFLGHIVLCQEAQAVAGGLRQSGRM